MESQLEKIHSHLVHHGSITSWDAIMIYHITRLSEYIRQLRADYGMDIVSTRESKDGKWWVRYSYEKRIGR